MTESGSLERSNVVKIHIEVTQRDDTLHIDFPFDKQVDDIETVVSDLIQAIGVTEAERPKLRSMIEAQLQNDTSKLELITADQANSDESSDDDVCKNPKYLELLERQRQDMASLLQSQLEEKRALAMKIQKEPMLYVGQGQTEDHGDDLIILN